MEAAALSYHVLPKSRVQPQSQGGSGRLQRSLTPRPRRLQLGSKDAALKPRRSGEAQLREQAEHRPR